ncbi:MAG: APC family permease [Planctomycetia bacterium]|nr:APC family permease [Planctomycetia bacterium]
MNSPQDSLKKNPQDASEPNGSPSSPESPLEEFENLTDQAAQQLGIDPTKATLDESRTLGDRFKTVLIGKPRDLTDTSIYHTLSLAAFLAWVGLGADGLSSSAYGPAEAFGNLITPTGDHTYLAIFLALATAITVFIISACYSHIIEEFPTGGGGYLVASKLLGRRVGVISGCALLVDYALTITVSIAAAGDALFGLLGTDWTFANLPPDQCKLLAEFAAIAVLIVLNLRGIKESVMVLVPIFMVFLLTHAILILGTLVLNVGAVGSTAEHITSGIRDGLEQPGFGLFGMLLLFLHAYSLGAGTYTGIEAVSNSMPVMREPRVATGKRTMVYMATSLALTAGGLMIGYLLLNIRPTHEKTMNQLLTEGFVDKLGLPGWSAAAFVLVTVVSEGALLIVAAQAGFIDGPRVLASMARDSWVPHWFANLSERLATHNGVFLMGLAGLAALWVTGGNVSKLVIMYSINVFVTFSLSMIGMCRHWYDVRRTSPLWRRRLALFVFGAVMCLSILVVTVTEKFEEGGWVTLAVTGLCVGLCFSIRHYYDRVVQKLERLSSLLEIVTPTGTPVAGEPDPKKPSAAILVGGYSGLGVHTFLNAIRFGPGKFDSVLFLSVGVVDSGNFKGGDAVKDLRQHTASSLDQYVDHARRLGMPASGFMAIGTDPVDELEHLCVAVKKRFPRAIFFAGRLVFQKDTWYQRLLHNETSYSLQRRLQWDGVPMVILPTRVK